MKHWKLIIAGLAFFAAFVLYIKSLVQPPQPPQDSDKPVIAVSFYPLEFVAQSLLDDSFEILTMTPSGVEPHDFEPSPQDIIRLQQADLFFYNGLGLDSWVSRLEPTLVAQGVQLINVGEALEDSGLAIISLSDTDDHEDGEAHEHGDEDPHIWTDPVYMKAIAEMMGETIIEKYGSTANGVSAKQTAFAQTMEDLDTEFASGLKLCVLREVIVSHNAFAYLASRYDFAVTSIAGFSPQEQPSAKRLGELATLAQEKGIETIYFETLVSPKLSETLAQEVGARTAVLDPVEGIAPEARGAGADYVSIMRQNLEALRLGMKCQ